MQKDLHQHILEILAERQKIGAKSLPYLIREEGTTATTEQIKTALTHLISKRKVTTSTNIGVTFYHSTEPKRQRADRVPTTADRIKQLEQQITQATRELDAAERTVSTIEGRLFQLRKDRDALQQHQAAEADRLQGLQREVAA